MISATPPRVHFLTDNVSSESALDRRKVWLPLRSSLYVQTWEECESVSHHDNAKLPLGAVCGGNTHEANRFALGLHIAASQTLRKAPTRELKAKTAVGAGVQLLREVIRAAAVSHFVDFPEETLHAAWAKLRALGEEICSLPRLAFLNLLNHRLCTSGEVRRRLRHRRLHNLAPEEERLFTHQSTSTNVAAVLENMGWNRRKILCLVTELGIHGLRLSEELEHQVLTTLSTTALSSTQLCENCGKSGILKMVMVRGKGKRKLTLRHGEEARFFRKVDTHIRKHPRNRWRLKRLCSLCSVMP